MSIPHTPHALEHLPIDSLIPYARNARTHSPEQIKQIAASMREFGFTAPVLIDADGGIIAGHGRVMAARQIGLKEVPCIRLGHLTEAQKRAYVLADNRLGENSAWDENMLAAEIEILEAADFDLFLAGFDVEDLPFGGSDDESESSASSVHEIEVKSVRASFWISIRGPLEQQAYALRRLQTVMAELPIEVEMGTVANELG